jgi:hypothetical protein
MFSSFAIPIAEKVQKSCQFANWRECVCSLSLNSHNATANLCKMITLNAHFANLAAAATEVKPQNHRKRVAWMIGTAFADLRWIRRRLAQSGRTTRSAA